MSALPEPENPPPAPESRDSRPPESGLRLWLEVLERALVALERAVWRGRHLAEQAAATGEKVERSLNEALREAARWPGRLSRLSRSAWMLARVTASYRLWGTRSAFIPEARRAEALEKLHRTNARRFRDTSLEQGGAFLKIGQLLSSRPDLLPEAWIEELEVLQDEARPEDFETVEAILEEDLGQPVSELFSSLDCQPLASASIGQVHRAVLADGREVAVKVRRPGLREIVEQDMALLGLFAESIRSLLPPMDLDTVTTELRRTIRTELDYRQEQEAMRRVGETLADMEGVRVPVTVDELCSDRVLTTEFVHGRKLTTVLDELREAGEEYRIAAMLERVLDAWFAQVLEAGFFQADPHPGNLLVTGDDELVLLDFGSSMELPDHFRRGYFRILQATIVEEREEIARILTELGFVTRSGDPETLMVFADLLLRQLQDAMVSDDPAGGVRWPSPMELVEQGRQVLEHTEADPVDRVPAEFIMLARVFATLGGLYLHYRPQVDMARLVMPYLTRPLHEPASC